MGKTHALTRPKGIILLIVVVLASVVAVVALYPRGSQPPAEIVEDQTACWAWNSPTSRGTYLNVCDITVKVNQVNGSVSVRDIEINGQGSSGFYESAVNTSSWCWVNDTRVFPISFPLQSGETFTFQEVSPPPPSGGVWPTFGLSPGTNANVIVVMTSGYTIRTNVTTLYHSAPSPANSCPA